MYALGIDLGTTFTAAAVWRDGHGAVCSLGSRSAAVPSVVVLREDETIITGETASRRALTTPHRVAREFKRRLGDTTPILLGGVPYSAEALMGRMLRAVVEEVTTREGGAPSAVCVSHPANWGPYKIDLLRQAVRSAGLDDASFTTEPEAAAVFYAQQQRIPDGAVVAVYDLGGGTFDAAVLRKTSGGFEILGRPEGIERLGGIDIDAAVYAHVGRAVGDALAQLDEDDPSAVAAVARLREECVQAKEALSSDTDTTIPVLLPNLATEVRLTRAELEAMVRPALQDTLDALRRALRSAGVTPEELHSVLLVGGSSRMPIVAQLVGAELGRPVAVDAHPKHAVALGAAWLASGAAFAAGPASGVAGSGAAALGAAALGAAASGAAASGAAASAVAAPGAMPPPGATEPMPVTPAWAAADPTPTPAPGVPMTPVADPWARPAADDPAARHQAPTRMMGPVDVGPAPTGAKGAGPARAASGAFVASGSTGSGAGKASGGRRGRPGPVKVAAAAAALLLLAGGTAVAVNALGIGQGGAGTSDPTQTASVTKVAAGSGSTSPSPSTPSVPEDEACTEAIKANPRWVCLTDATFDGLTLTIEYDASFAGATPDVSGGYHLHVYGGDGTDPAEETMGLQDPQHGRWYVEDRKPSKRKASSQDYAKAVGDAPKVCARIATARHRLVKDLDGGFHTGNCVPIRRV